MVPLPLPAKAVLLIQPAAPLSVSLPPQRVTSPRIVPVSMIVSTSLVVVWEQASGFDRACVAEGHDLGSNAHD